ncbi:ABC transporter substrate-binding protein [bacterium]|nr:ABC transporter substrate-binding protein [bacterium]
MKKFVGAVLLILLILFALQASRRAPSSQSVPQEDVRIVSLAPNLTEILFELGVGEQVVGVTKYFSDSSQGQQKEEIGDFFNPNLEKIVSLKPTLVIAEHWPSSRTVPRLREFGLPVLETISPTSLEEIYQIIREVGKVVDRSQPAETLIQSMKKRLRVVKERAVQLSDRPSVYIEVDLPTWTIGKRSFITEAFHLAGARNLFDDVEKRALQASKETIIDRNPDIILTYTVSGLVMSQRPGWDRIKAVKNGRILDDFDRDLLSHGNHRLIEGMEKFQARILAMMSEP